MTAKAAWTEGPRARRRAERERLLRLAGGFVNELERSLPVMVAVVFGSVARGDFNVWSDVDLLVLARGLPARPQDRLEILAAGAPAGVQAIAWTPEEFVRQLTAGNPIAREAAESGVVLRGQAELARLLDGVRRS